MLMCYAHAFLSIYITFNFAGCSKVKDSLLSLSLSLDFFKSTRQTNVNLYHANIITTWFRIYLHRTNAEANIYEQVARRNHQPWTKCSFSPAMYFCQNFTYTSLLSLINIPLFLPIFFLSNTECVSFIISLIPTVFPSLINLFCVILSLHHEGNDRHGGE